MILKKLKLFIFLSSSLFLLCFFYLFASSKSNSSHLLPSSNSPLLFYSNQLRQNLQLILSQGIEEASSSIFIKMYELTDPHLINLLNKRIKEGIQIAISVDQSGYFILQKKLNKKISLFSTSQNGLMHEKILIIDHKLVFLGSANMTHQSLKLHHNLIIGLFHPHLASFLESHIYSTFEFFVEGKKAQICLLPATKDLTLEKMIQIIKEAKKSIFIAMFTFTHPQLIEALIDAHKRKVNVEVAIDFYTCYGASKKWIERLNKEGISVRISKGQELLHHKLAIIDKKILIQGSANWTRSAFERNQDYILIIYELTSIQRKFLNQLWDVIQLESLPLKI